MKVVFTECSEPFWVDVAARLQQEHGWEPCYWTAMPRVRDAVAKHFPDAVFHPTLDAVRAIPASGVEGVAAALDAPLLRAMAPYELEALVMMDRMDIGASFLFGERLRHYNRLASYWLGVLRTRRPDLVVFQTIPHIIYDFVLYGLCRVLGVPTVMFEFTKMRGLAFATSSYEDDSELLQEYRRLLATPDAASAGLSPETERYLQSLTRSADDLPFYIQPFYMHRPYVDPNAARPEPPRVPLLQRPRRAASALKARLRNALAARRETPPANYLKLRGARPEESWIGRNQYRRFRRRAGLTMRKLEGQYGELAQPVDLERPYVYFALNFQPERTTSPLGGMFVQQLLMVQLVAASLPVGWLLYVKEHPTQFFPRKAFRAQCTRSADFYDDLAATANVRLVPMEVSSLDLTDRARAVAVVSGTAGWEAVNRGKPAIMGGRPWYVGCEGIFQVTTKEECATALQRIAAGYRVDAQKVRLFAQALEHIGFRGYVEPSYKRVVGISEEENVAVLSEALAGFWQRHYGARPPARKL